MYLELPGSSSRSALTRMFRLNVTRRSGIVTADSGHQGNSVTFARNRRSRLSGISGHVGLEYPIATA